MHSLTFFSISSSVEEPVRSKGCRPVSMMYRITPRDHMSIAGVGGSEECLDYAKSEVS